MRRPAMFGNKVCNECGRLVEFKKPVELWPDDEWICEDCECGNRPSDEELDYVFGSDGWRGK